MKFKKYVVFPPWTGPGCTWRKDHVHREQRGFHGQGVDQGDRKHDRENTIKRPTEKTVKLETCFEYLDTRDDYSVMMMMIFVIFRTVTLTDLLLRSPSFMSNARGPQESPHLSMKVLLTFIQNLLKKHLELR